MKHKQLFIVISISLGLAACGGTSTTNPMSTKNYSSSASSSASHESSASESSSASSLSETASTVWTCPSDKYFFCDDFSILMDQWALNPATKNSSEPNGTLEWVQLDGNGMLRHTANSKGGIVALLDTAAMSNVPSADYAVEAKIRPRVNSTTGNKQLYLVTRYQDGNNWYAGVLNVQNDSSATQVEIAKMTEGSVARPKQVKRPIQMGANGANDGVWYDLRIESVGDQLRVYLDGEFIAEWQDPSPILEKGTIALWTANKSFEVDDVRIIDAASKPASLTLEPSDTDYMAEALDEAKVITVNALKADASPDEFYVESSAPEVVAVNRNGQQVSLTPLSEGSARIRFTSASDKHRIREINAVIAPHFEMPVAQYSLADKVIPDVGAINSYEDQSLKILFDNPVALNQVGLVRIYNKEDDSLVDTISVINEVDSLGVGANLRKINVNAITAHGNTLSITPHAGKLQLGKTYWVAIGKNLIAENRLNGQLFEGIGKASGWSFTVREQAPAANLTELLVDDDGHTAHFRSVQSALNYAMQQPLLEKITINNGIYSEPLYLQDRNNLIIRGESRENTRIEYENNNGLNPSTDGRALFLINNSDHLLLENFTIKNTTLIAQGGQAETLYFNSANGRLMAKNMNFISEQDTLLVKGWSWFYKSLIAGNVDFIWGYPKASLFEQSEIRTLGDSRGNGNGGYVLQARIENVSDIGFVFLNSQLTQGIGPKGHLPEQGKTYLARSGGNSQYFDNIAFINTRMDSHIAPIGWAGLGINNQPAATPSLPTNSAGWREFSSMDLQGNILQHPRQFMYQLSAHEIENYCSRKKVFASFNQGAGWDPLPNDHSDCHASNKQSALERGQ